MRVRPRRLTRITTDPYTQPAVAIPWPVTAEGPVRQATPPVSDAGVAGGSMLSPASVRSARVGAGSAASERAVETPGTRRRADGPRVLVGGVGYRNLRDMSAGPEMIDRLRALEWPPGVEVEDLSFGAVHVLHWLQDRPPFDAVVLFAAVARGRPPGSVVRLAWTAPPMTGEAVQEAIAEAVTGVLSLDTLFIVLGYFAALPPRVTVIEIEPRDDDWGPAFSPLVQSALDDAVRLVTVEVQALLHP